MIILGEYNFKKSEYKKFDKNTVFIFRQLKKLIMSKIVDISIEHTGSSATGIGGKNIIDTLVICPNKKYGRIIKKIESLGFIESPFKNIPKSRPLRVGTTIYNGKKYLIHIHFTYKNSEDHKNIIFFRDYMKKHKDLCKKYIKLKKKAVKLGLSEGTGYNDYKESLIKEVLLKRDEHK